MFAFLLRVLLFTSFCTNVLLPMHGINRILAAAFTKPGHVPVYMDHSNRLILPSNNQGDKPCIISTGDLRGCFVTVVYLQNEDRQYVIMTHFHHAKLMEHAARLREEIRPVADKYNYAHGLIFYFNGKSFFSTDVEKIKRYTMSDHTKQYLSNAAFVAEKTCDRLSAVMQENLLGTELVISHIPYVLGPTDSYAHKGLPFEGKSAEIEVFLSQDKNKPSHCKIKDADSPIIWCDTRLGRSIETNSSAPLTYIRARE